jgi:hypothetical protein
MRSIKITAILAASALLLQGCLKSKGVNFANEDSPTPNVVDFNSQSDVASFDIVTAPTIYTFYAELNSANKSYPAGTSVTIAKTPTLVTGAGYEFLPDSAYQLVNITATVDPATHLAAFQLKIFTTKIDLSHAYAVGYTITTTTNGVVIAKGKETKLIAIVAKNQYEATYTADGYFYHPASPRAINGLDVDVLTAGPNTVTTNLGDLGNVILLTIDAGNNVTVADVGIGPGVGPTHALPSLAAGSPPLYSPFPGSNPAAYTNKYDPATHKFYLRYGYLGGTGYRDVEEILTRQ